jgi:hypothetical protein
MRVGRDHRQGLNLIVTKVFDASFATTVKDVPPGMDPLLAAVASVAADVPRGPAPLATCLTCSGSGLDIHVATDGPRTPVIVADDRRVAELWLYDVKRWVRGDDLWLNGFRRDGSLEITGTASVVHADGSTKPVVFHQGVRLDPLGYATVEAYERAPAADRDTRAKKHARAAHARRGADAKLGIALRQATTGTNEALTHLDAARLAIVPTEQTSDRHERAIRGAHAAIERAHLALLDAVTGIDTTLDRIADDDPALDAVGALGAHVRDLDERLRVLLVAFDAFEFTDDLDRLSRITTALAAALAALPAPALQARLDALRAALAAP